MTAQTAAPVPSSTPVRVPITWAEIVRTPDRQLRRMLAERHRAIMRAHDAGPPPTASELSDLLNTIAELAAWVRRRRTRTETEEERGIRARLVQMVHAEEARLNEAAQSRYAEMATEVDERIRAEQVARDYVQRRGAVAA